ncbi:MAG: YfiR family protein [Planctomycetales bacterium]|nr:YfiR family protein [Planctomycetales bacterium]
MSKAPDGRQRGATINFVRVGKTIKLEIKQSAAKAAGLVINAKLLRLTVNTETE